MKALFIADIHGCFSNLELIEKIMNSCDIDHLYVLGDIFHSSYTKENIVFSNSKVIEFLNKFKDKMTLMRGNCDLEDNGFNLIDDYLKISLDNNEVYITHGDYYNHEDGFDFDDKIVILGHYHRPFVKKNNCTFICVGSISIPRDSNCGYAIYENNEILLYDIYGDLINGVNIS